MIDNDTELMLRARDGEELAFRELFDRHYKRAVRIAYRSIGDIDKAEDIAMDAFARVYQARDKYKASAKFTTYLYKVVINLCINTAKREKLLIKQQLDEALPLKDTGPTPSESLARSELSRFVKKAIIDLPDNQRIALILTNYEDMSYKAAAEVMNVSVGALESLLHRAKVNLRKSLGGYINK